MKSLASKSGMPRDGFGHSLSLKRKNIEQRGAMGIIGVVSPVPCQNSHTSSELVLGSPAVFVDQAADDVGALDPSGHVDWLACGVPELGHDRRVGLLMTRSVK